MLGLTVLACALPVAYAQTAGREFPLKALRGMLEITAPPEILIDGRAARLSPGARIRDTQNMIIPPAQLMGRRWLVNFVLESNGLVHEAWLLTPEEAATRGRLATPDRNFVFGSEAHPAPRDDGKTPFNQLPKFPQR